MFSIGVFAIIFNQENQVLLCHRRDMDVWNLPGGGLERSETPWAGVIREVYEETGLFVAVDRLVGVYNKPHKDELVFSFSCSITGGNIMLTDEADKIRFFAVDKIPTNTIPKQIERIHDALSQYKHTLLKVQSGPTTLELL
jgi:ADP-ribose pyrophosphatase YjhB (NUDIX family)